MRLLISALGMIAGILRTSLVLASVQSPTDGFAAVNLTAEDLDPQAFVQWVDGAEKQVESKDGPRRVIWTANSAPQWDGVRFSDSKQAGPRHLRIGFNKPIPVGSVLVRCGGQLSVLKADAKYPGVLNDDSQWLPAARLAQAQAGRDEVKDEEYAIWVLPPNTTTRALRFTHTAQLIDKSYAGWLGGVYVLPQRLANMAPMALAFSSANSESAGKVNNSSNDKMWGAWENGKEGGSELISTQHAEWIVLSWPTEVRLCGLNALWAGFATAEVQAYTGPADRHPRQSTDADWKTLRQFTGIEHQYPRSLATNWLDFGQTITTRAIRLRMTKVGAENHDHLRNRTAGGKRVWLGELMALTPLGDAALETAAIAPPATADLGHPPIPIRFTLAEPAVVTLVIDDAAGKRVRNLVAQTPFPAGQNTVWWDGMDDLGRDTEAAKHGIYSAPGQFVRPGAYRVRGLSHQPIDLRFEFSIYNGGNPAWETADSTGGWLTNHTPPSAALFVPADRSPTGKAMIYLGSYVAEGGHGLAWFDLDGKKQGGRGWVGGVWTGAPYLARDAGADRDPATHVYVGAAWEGDLRLTALTNRGDKALTKFKFPGGKGQSVISGLAVHNGLLACSLPKLEQILFVDARTGTILGGPTVRDARGLAFDSQGRLLALVGKALHRYQLPQNSDKITLPAPQVLVTDLEDPQSLALDSDGGIYISDRGQAHQVKAYSPDGKFLRAIGHPGIPKAGPYDPQHLNNPKGLAIDGNSRLWVTEEDYQPKRVSVWTLDGQFIRAFYGPSEYGGGGKLDPADKTRFYYHGMEFKLDWQKGTDQLVSVLYRPGAGDLGLPDGHACDGQPEMAIYVGARRYFTNWHNSNPTNGSPIAMLWMDRNGIAAPVAACGRANDWSIFKTDVFKSRLPASVDLKGEYWKNQLMFVWSDLNGDGHIQPDEVQFDKTTAGGITVMPDLAFIASRAHDSVMRFAPARFTAQGAPVYELDKPQTLVAGAQPPASSGGDQALYHPDGWTITSIAVKPWSNYSLGGSFKGTSMWSYPSLWPGLHASHESPAPDFPGEVIGTTRLLGGFITPPNSDAGPLWCINGNQGNMYLFTADGLFVAELFKDIRTGQPWSMPVAQRNMLLNDVSLHDENFWPSITQTADGQTYLVDGARTSIVRVDGLQTIKRLPDASLQLTADDLKSAQAYQLQRETTRQTAAGQQTLTVPMLSTTPKVDGQLDDWSAAQWVTIDKRGVAAYFNSNSKPYDVSAALAISGDRLYAAFRTGDKDLLRNSGDMPNALFKTGGALDLMLSTNPSADPKRTRPAQGDQRLLITMVKGKPVATLYRAVVPGTKEPVPFSSPWRTITLDRVDNVTDQIQLAGANGNYELSIPLSVLGLKPTPGQTLKGDLGILRGNGFQTLHRVYWSNKATGITADVPSEAELTPGLWGTLLIP